MYGYGDACIGTWIYSYIPCMRCFYSYFRVCGPVSLTMRARVRVCICVCVHTLVSSRKECPCL